MRNFKKMYMPVEHLRRIRSVHRQVNISSLGAMKYLPLSLYSLLSNIPMPWESSKVVDLLYHVNGSISFIESKSKSTKEEYIYKWNEVTRNLKRDGINSIRFPVFEDDEEIFEYRRIQHKNNKSDAPRTQLLHNTQHSNHNFQDYVGVWDKKRLLDFNTFERRNSSRVFNFHEIPIYKSKNKVSKSFKGRSSPSINLKKYFKNTRFFQTTQMEWVEAGLVILSQGHEMLNEIIRKKKLSYLYLDYNFNLKHTRALTTKERKKSRLGVSFHLTREILKLTKLVVDAHVVHKLGVCSSDELCVSLEYLFSNVGILTGIYRYKYKTMKQIKKCKEVEENAPWSEKWRVYVFMLRGYNSLLRRYLSDLVGRMVNGREYREKPLKKQRVESNFDLELKNKMVEEMKGKFNKVQIDLILRHMNEGWRSWKANVEYSVGGVVDEWVSRFVGLKSEWYCNRVTKKGHTDDLDFSSSKDLGRITRLWMKEESERQRRYLENPRLSPEVAMGVYKVAFDYFSSLGSPRIPFPERNEVKHLQLAVEKLKVDADDQEVEFYEKVLGNPEVYIFKIKKSLLTQRKFREIGARVVQNYASLNVVYSVNYLERLTDAFLSSFLFYEGDRLFPSYLKPSDEIEMKMVHDFSLGLCKEGVEIHQVRYRDVMKNIDNNLLKRLLKIFVDPILVDYMISRNNSTVSYKDMSYVNTLGYISGFSFSPFIFKAYTFFLDLCVFPGVKNILRYLDTLYIVEKMDLEMNHSFRGLVSVEYTSSYNFFSMAGVDVYVGKQKGTWYLKDGYWARVSLSSKTLRILKGRVDQIIRSSQSSTFLKVVTKWNSTVTGFVNRYREIIQDRSIFYPMEKKIQEVVMKGINSKMPVRFPPVVFYSPRAYGGLEMVSASGRYQEEAIPSILDYYKPWHKEFEDSDRAWGEFSTSGCISKDLGLPRMSTLLQKDKISFYDRSFRICKIFRKFTSSRYDPGVFTSLRHDGRLFSLEDYSEEMLKTLGDVLGHTLFKATYARRFDRLFWDDSYLTKYSTTTRAQKRGLSQIPNRRFILWWSPTINRACVYVGYQTQLDPTGIQMHGKLPTLKMSYLNIFRNNLWKKIHESIIFDIHQQVSLFCDCVRNDGGHLLLLGNFKGDVKEVIMFIFLRWGDYDRKDSFKYAKAKYHESNKGVSDHYLVVVIDLCYSTFGYYSPQEYFPLDGILEKVMSSNVSLHILRERIRTTLDIYTPDIITVSSPKELFHNTLIVEDRGMYKKDRTLVVLEPETGNVFTKRVEGKKPRLLRTSVAEDIFQLAVSTGKSSILVRKDMADTLEMYLVDYPETTLKIFENDIPFYNLIKFPKDNLYKNWFGISKFTAFCRLVLLLKGGEPVSSILPDDEWIKKEREMKDRIVEEYCSRNVLNPKGLSQADIRDIVFGCYVRNETTTENNNFSHRNLPYNLPNGEIATSKNFSIPNREICTTSEYCPLLIREIPTTKNCSIQKVENPTYIPRNLLALFSPISPLKFSLLVRVMTSDDVALAFIPQYSTPSQIHSTRYIPPGFTPLGIVINTSDSKIIQEILGRYSFTNPLVLIFEESITSNGPVHLLEDEGGCYVSEVWDYSRTKEYFFDDLEYSLVLGLP